MLLLDVSILPRHPFSPTSFTAQRELYDEWRRANVVPTHRFYAVLRFAAGQSVRQNKRKLETRNCKRETSSTVCFRPHSSVSSIFDLEFWPFDPISKPFASVSKCIKFGENASSKPTLWDVVSIMLGTYRRTTDAPTDKQEHYVSGHTLRGAQRRSIMINTTCDIHDVIVRCSCATPAGLRWMIRLRTNKIRWSRTHFLTPNQPRQITE